MNQASAPARRELCPACGDSGHVTIALRNDQAHTDQVLTQACTYCLPPEGAADRAAGGAGPRRLLLPRAARALLFALTAGCGSASSAVLLSLLLSGTALGAAWLAVTAALCLAATACFKAAAGRARKAGFR